MPVIRLREEVYVKLKALKHRLNHATYSDTVAYLISKATSPATFLESAAWFLEDMRSDIKELKELIKELNHALTKLM